MEEIMMIAPCGMNCNVCIGYIREKNKCPRCMSLDLQSKPKYCRECKIKYCDEHSINNNEYCYACDKFPCVRMKRLDKRYILRYRTSLIANLKEIEVIGLKEFVKKEKEKWICKNCGEKLSVHRNICIKCKTERPF